jgi:ribosomal protein L7/L12
MLESNRNTAHSPLPSHVLDALERGSTVEAIKLLREATGLGLGDAKAAIDSHRSGEPITLATHSGSLDSLPPEVLAALRQGKKVEAIRLMRAKTGLGLKAAKDAVEQAHQPGPAGAVDQLSPGEVAKSGVGGWVVVVLLALAGVGYYLFSRFV